MSLSGPKGVIINNWTSSVHCITIVAHVNFKLQPPTPPPPHPPFQRDTVNKLLTTLFLENTQFLAAPQLLEKTQVSFRNKKSSPTFVDQKYA